MHIGHHIHHSMWVSLTVTFPLKAAIWSPFHVTWCHCSLEGDCQWQIRSDTVTNTMTILNCGICGRKEKTTACWKCGLLCYCYHNLARAFVIWQSNMLLHCTWKVPYAMMLPVRWSTIIKLANGLKFQSAHLFLDAFNNTAHHSMHTKFNLLERMCCLHTYLSNPKSGTRINGREIVVQLA